MSTALAAPIVLVLIAFLGVPTLLLATVLLERLIALPELDRAPLRPEHADLYVNGKER